jgi:hypothetical protein
MFPKCLNIGEKGSTHITKRLSDVLVGLSTNALVCGLKALQNEFLLIERVHTEQPTLTEPVHTERTKCIVTS